MTRLGAAAGEGRLTLVEFEDRVAQAFASKTRGELDVLVADLPAVPGGHGALVPHGKGSVLSILAVVGGLAWVPLFPFVDFGALPGAIGVVFGVLALRRGTQPMVRALAILGLVGGAAGVASQVLWLLFHLW